MMKLLGILACFSSIIFFMKPQERKLGGSRGMWSQRKLGTPLYKAPYNYDEEVIILTKKLKELEDRYEIITEEFDQLNKAGTKDQKRLDALWQEGNEIYDEKKKLNVQLDKIKMRKQELVTKFKRSTQAPSVEHEVAPMDLYDIEQKFKKLLFEYKTLINARKVTSNYIELQEIKRDLLSVYKDISELLNDSKIPKLTRKEYNDELEKIKFIVPSLPQPADEVLILTPEKRKGVKFKIKKKRREPVSERGIVAHKEQLSDKELVLSPTEKIITQPLLEQKRAKIEVHKQKNITPAQEQSSEVALRLLPEKSVHQVKPLIQPISKVSQKALQVQNEKLLNDALRELQGALLQLNNKFSVKHI